MSRLSARQRGYSAKWQRESRAFLALPENRLCSCGCGRIANTVDHDTAHRGDQRLFWDRTNWRPWFRDCHNRVKQQIETWGYSSETGADGLPTDPHHPFNRGGAHA